MVVVNGSTDGTYSNILKFKEARPDWNIKLIEDPVKGISRARNRCLENASGEFILFLDHDDDICAENVKKLYDTAKLYPDINIFKGFRNGFFDEYAARHPGICDAAVCDKRILYDACKMNHGVSITTWMVRLSLIDRLRLKFDEKVLCGEDAVFLYGLLLEEPRMYISSLNIYCYNKIPKAEWHKKWPSDDYTAARYDDVMLRFKREFCHAPCGE